MTYGTPWWIKLLLGLIGLVVVATGALYGFGRQATARWETYADSLRAKGQPITFKEIEARRSVVPDDLNSARVIEGLAEDIKKLGEASNNNYDILVFGGGRDGERFHDGVERRYVEPSRQFVETQGELLQKLQALRDRPTGRFDVHFEETPLFTLLPHLTELRSLGKLLRLDAIIALIDNDIDRAVEDAVLQYRIAGSLHDEPMLISRLVQIAIEALSVNTVEDILRTTTPQDASLARLSDELRDMKAKGTMRWALLGERAFFVETCDAMAAGRTSLPAIATATNEGDESILPQMSWRVPTFLVRSNQLRGAEMYTWLVDAADDHDAMRQATWRLEAETPKLPRTQLIVKMLLPAMSRAAAVHTRISAQIECALTGLAAERYRLAIGRFPESLSELVPNFLDQIPIDPFDGQPIRIKMTENGLIVYTVDDDRVDNGGDVETDRSASKGAPRAPDLGFRMPNPERRHITLLDSLAGDD